MRKKNLLKLKPVLFIACEGTSSEYQYFESWAQTEEALNHFSRVDVYPDETETKPKTTPYELFETAKKQLESGAVDFAWIVFDKDNHPKLPETFFEAMSSNVKIAFSSRSFEQWVLMHFQKNSQAFLATECKDHQNKPTNCGSPEVADCAPISCLTGHIRRQNFIPNYSKKKTFDLYSAIHYRTEIAIVNVSWLRLKSNILFNGLKRDLHLLNPYTSVDQLILKLHDRSEIIEWGASGLDIVVDPWTINLNVVGNQIILKMSHNIAEAQVVNSAFLTSSLFTTDDELNDNPCNIVSSKYLDTSNGSSNPLLYRNDIIEYILDSNNQPYFLFKDAQRSLRIYVIL